MSCTDSGMGRSRRQWRGWAKQGRANQGWAKHEGQRCLQASAYTRGSRGL